MKTKDRRTCPSCGNQFSGAMEFCPVCTLRKALATGIESDGSSFNDTLMPAREQATRRFEHYDLLMGEDGKPLELGRGAMGITYKAYDVDLQCPVTLKVISERYLGDESAQLRFLREARLAARLRHSNVASVLHLGRTGSSYFYAMEFVEGKTLEKLIKRSGQIEVKLALEITMQVAAGLSAVHKQKLVHRDIKPSNIMVHVEEGSTLTAKIIDLGLAKPSLDTPADAAISMPGAFAGTPEFASPEQFAGVGVDIRSDLYSLGATLWKMLTGHVVFMGSPAAVMYKHQHAPLPRERLKDVPQPVIVLLEKLLEKDPAQRFQTPNELLKAMPTITAAIEARRRITRQSLLKTPPAISRLGSRKSPARLAPKKISLARLPITGSDVFGREEDHRFSGRRLGKSPDKCRHNRGLGAVLVNPRSSIIGFDGWPLIIIVLRSLFLGGPSTGRAPAGTLRPQTNFLMRLSAWFGDPDPGLGTAWEKGERMAKLVARRRTLLILDGLEPLQNPPGPQEGRLREPALQALLRELAAFNRGLCVITTRLPVADIADHERTSALRRDLEHLSSDAGAQLLRAMGVKGDEDEIANACDEFSGHSLALTLLGSYLTMLTMGIFVVAMKCQHV